jgi:carbon monoxide dehydrogenase subunit G
MAPMDLTHRFSVPAPVRKVWNAFNNVERLAPCFPGATITGVDGDEFAGKLKIKLGPAALVYNGSGRYVERNKTERRVLIEANGNDRRRNGTAAVTVTASFTANGNYTDVDVLTSLAITGKPAQFGEEVISDVSHRLLDQFVACISGRLAEDLGGVQAASRSLASRQAPQESTRPTSPDRTKPSRLRDSTKQTPSRPSNSRRWRPRMRR